MKEHWLIRLKYLLQCVAMGVCLARILRYFTDFDSKTFVSNKENHTVGKTTILVGLKRESE